MKRTFYHTNALGQPMSGSLKDGQLGSGDIMATHVHAHQRAGGTDDGDEAGTIYGSAAGLGGGGGRPDALCVGLGSDHTEHQRQASADVFESSTCHHVAVAVMYALSVGDVVESGHHRVGIDGLYAVHDASNAFTQIPHHGSGGEAGDVEQHQLDDAACTGTAYAAKEDKEHNEYSTDDCRPRQGDMEKAGDHGRRGEHLRHDADEDTDEEKYRADGLGTAAILSRHNLEERGAVAFAQRTGIDQGKHQCTEGGTNSEPPRRDAETESQLSRANGGLSAHQRAEYGATDHPRA